MGTEVKFVLVEVARVHRLQRGRCGSHLPDCRLHRGSESSPLGPDDSGSKLGFLVGDRVYQSVYVSLLFRRHSLSGSSPSSFLFATTQMRRAAISPKDDSCKFNILNFFYLFSGKIKIKNRGRGPSPFECCDGLSRRDGSLPCLHFPK